MEDKSVPTLVKALGGHKIVAVGCGSGDAHTIALEDNGNGSTLARLPPSLPLNNNFYRRIKKIENGQINNSL